MAEDAKPGHNAPKSEEVMGFINRVERLEEEKAALSDDIKAVKQEASEAGITTKALNEILRQRKQQRKMGREAYKDFKDECDILVDSLGQSYWAFEQADIEDAAGGESAAVH